MDWLSLETPMVGTESIIYSNILRFYLVARWYETFIFVSYVHKSNMQDLLVATINFTGMCLMIQKHILLKQNIPIEMVCNPTSEQYIFRFSLFLSLESVYSDGCYS